MCIRRIFSWLLAGGAVMLASQAVGQQTPQSYDNRWAYGNAPYSNARMESQPPLIPFGPHGFQHNAQPFAPADISDYGTGPKPKVGWFFSYDRLIWTLSKPSTETSNVSASKPARRRSPSGIARPAGWWPSS